LPLGQVTKSLAPPLPAGLFFGYFVRVQDDVKHGDHTALIPIKRGDDLDAAELYLPSALEWDLTLLDWTAVKIDLPDVVISGLRLGKTQVDARSICHGLRYCTAAPDRTTTHPAGLSFSKSQGHMLVPYQRRATGKIAQPLEETMQMLANWRDLSVDEAKAKLLAELFPAREMVKGGSAVGGSSTIRGEAGAGRTVKD
jgi:hypothetical protein